MGLLHDSGERVGEVVYIWQLTHVSQGMACLDDRSGCELLVWVCWVTLGGFEQLVPHFGDGGVDRVAGGDPRCDSCPGCLSLGFSYWEPKGGSGQQACLGVVHHSGEIKYGGWAGADQGKVIKGAS
jgi:hypothetical protein